MVSFFGAFLQLFWNFGGVFRFDQIGTIGPINSTTGTIGPINSTIGTVGPIN